MRLRSLLDQYYAKGRTDALEAGMPDPFLLNHSDYRYARWAYDAGYAEGQRVLHRIWEAKEHTA